MEVFKTICPELIQVNKLGREVCNLPGIKMFSADVKVEDNFKNLSIWTEKELGYLNRWGYQAFGIDYYWRSTILCKRFESDYNTFIVVDSSGGRYDTMEIEIWENIFWPTAYDTIAY